MSIEDPALSWYLYLRPSCSAPDRPSWPAAAAALVGEVQAGEVDPIHALLAGPLPERVLLRQASEASSLWVAGLGRGLVIAASVSRGGSFDREPPMDELRRDVLARLLGLDETGTSASTQADVPTTVEDMSNALLERWGGDPQWDFHGIAEVSTALSLGSSEGEGQEGWMDHQGLLMARGTGVGAGHLGWKVVGSFERSSERQVMERRLGVLRDGHLERSSVLCDYGFSALAWGEAARRAARASKAIEEVCDKVGLASSLALTGGLESEEHLPAPRELAARLDALRAGLEEDLASLEAGRRAMDRSLRRLFGEDLPYGVEGPFVEASSRGMEAVEGIRSRLRRADHWARALDRVLALC